MLIDSEAQFRPIFDRYFRALCRFFSKRGIALEVSRDLAQDTLFKVYLGMSRFEAMPSEEGLAAWVFAIAANVWRNEVRRRNTGRRSGEEVPLEAEHGVSLSSGDGSESGGNGGCGNPLGALLAEEKAQFLRQAVGALPDRMRTCVIMWVDQGRSPKEIAQILQVSEKTVRSQMRHARDRLRSELRRYFTCPEDGGGS